MSEDFGSFKPMLAYTLKKEEFDKVDYPVLASPKIDGIRVIIRSGKAYTRNGKLVRNKFIQSILGDERLNDLDGEITVGAPNSSECYKMTSSGVMSEDGEPDFFFHVFDYVKNLKEDFIVRFVKADEIVEKIKIPQVKILNHTTIEDEETLSAYEQEAVSLGFEGIMIRKFSGSYKCGRSTFKEQYLMKLKRFVEREGIVIDFIEEYQNTNEAKKDALNRTKRSLSQEGMVPKNTLGALVLSDVVYGVIEVGSGYTKDLRKEIWDNKQKYLGKLVTYKFFDYGSYDKPRHPVFKGFREDL